VNNVRSDASERCDEPKKEPHEIARAGFADREPCDPRERFELGRKGATFIVGHDRYLEEGLIEEFDELQQLPLRTASFE
jgi:hypothetical protein